MPLTPAESPARRAICWTLAALFLALAVRENAGRYSPLAMVWLTGSIGSALLGLLAPRWLERLPSTQVALNFVLAGCATLFVSFWGVDGESKYAIFQYLGSLVVCGGIALLLARMARTPLFRRLLFPAFLIFNTLFSVMAVVGARQEEQVSPRFPAHVRNDVQIFAQEACRLLSEGKNPYAVRMPNVMGADMPFYPAGATGKDNRLPFGYPYMPLSALFSLPGYWLGDLRFANIFALIAGAALLAYARPSVTSQLAATAFLLFPSSLFMLLMSWTEPVAVFFLALTVFCYFRAPKWLFLALGCLCASKQYTVFLLPILVLLLPDKTQRWTVLGQSLGVAALLTLPMALWDIDGFYRSAVQMQFKQPFRMDSMSYFIPVIHMGGPQLSPIIGFAALLGALFLGAKRAPRTAAGWCSAGAVAYLGFFSLNKQAFANYYFWIFGLLFTAVAVAFAADGAVEGETAPEQSPLS